MLDGARLRRVSTDDQTLDRQREQLRGLRAAVRERCPAPAATDRARRDCSISAQDDVVVVTRLDRLARSTGDLLEIAETIRAKDAGLRSLAEPWADTTSLRAEWC